MIRPELYEVIQSHAKEHYEDGGWDVIVECFDHKELDELIGEDVSTLREALVILQPIVDVWADRQADARNSAF